MYLLRCEAGAQTLHVWSAMQTMRVEEASEADWKHTNQHGCCKQEARRSPPYHAIVQAYSPMHGPAIWLLRASSKPGSAIMPVDVHTSQLVSL